MDDEDQQDKAFRERIRDAIQLGGKSGVMSQKTGIPVGTLNKYVALRSSPSGINALKIAKAIGVSVEELAEGSDSLQSETASYETLAKTSEAKVQTLPVSVDDDERTIVRLPRYDVRASAGRGLIPISAMPVGEVAFARAFLRRLGGNPENCYVLEASGDSMWPTIDDGDLLIADGSQTEIDDGRIYHFNAGERVLVKRARWAMDGRLRLTSDNAAAGYPDEIVGADTAADFRAGGRIIFSGGSPPPVR